MTRYSPWAAGEQQRTDKSDSALLAADLLDFVRAVVIVTEAGGSRSFPEDQIVFEINPRGDLLGIWVESGARLLPWHTVTSIIPTAVAVHPGEAF